MKVLALDVATTCGCAIGEAGGTPRAWSVDLGKRLSDGERFAKSIGLARWACQKFEPDLVAIEAPVGGAKTSHLLVGMWACIAGEVNRAGITSIKVNIAAVRKHFLGKHLTTKHFPGLRPDKAKLEIKRTVMNRCAALGWQVEDHDSADAAAIWDFVCATHHPSHHTTTLGGLFNER